MRTACAALMTVLAMLLLGGCGSGGNKGAAHGVAAAQPFPGLTVFGDGLAPGWVDASWNSTTKLDITSPVYAGERALSLTVVKPYGGLYLRSQDGADVSAYTVLRFAAQASAQPPQPSRYSVWLTDPTGNQLSPPRALDGYGGQPIGGDWRVYRIPLADLDPKAQKVGGIVLQDGTGGGQPALYVDAIGFSAGPTGTPAAAASPAAELSPAPTVAAPPTATPTPAQPSATSTTAPSAPTPAVTPPSATPAASPGTAAQPLPMTIFAGKLAADWTDVSFGATADFTLTTPTYTGGPVIGVRFTQPAGAFAVRSSEPLNLANYFTLRFVARSAAAGAKLELRVADVSGKPLGAGVLLDNYGGQPTPDGWTIYRIPVAAFAADQPVSELIVQGASGDAQPELYLDDVLIQ